MNSTGIKEGASRVALVLSGGSARGIAHVGILSVLEEHHIPISLILAASYGSIVGAYYSYGYSPDELLRMMKEFKLKRVFEYRKPWKGILSAEKTLSLFEKDLPGAKVESLNIPLSILATGTPDDVKGYCKKLIDVVGKGGGFIMAPSTSLDDAKPENVKAMIDFTKEYGVYS